MNAVIYEYSKEDVEFEIYGWFRVSESANPFSTRISDCTLEYLERMLTYPYVKVSLIKKLDNNRGFEFGLYYNVNAHEIIQQYIDSIKSKP